MIQLDLTPEELKALLEVLDMCISDLRMEMCDTDRKNFREEIRERKEVLQKVVEALKQ